MKLLSLTIPGSNGSIEVEAPENIPTGGLSGDGGKIIGLAFTWLLIAAVIIALFFLLYGGGNYIMSQGDKTKIESARRTIIFAIVGLLVVLLSFFIVSFFGKALGVDFINISL